MIPHIDDFKKNSFGRAVLKALKLMSTSLKSYSALKIKSSTNQRKSERALGFPTLVVNQKNKIICNGCKICERACPSACIEVTLHHHHEVKMNIDYSRCLSCFVCEDVCPIDAISLKVRKSYLGRKDKHLIVCHEKLVIDDK